MVYEKTAKNVISKNAIFLIGCYFEVTNVKFVPSISAKPEHFHGLFIVANRRRAFFALERFQSCSIFESRSSLARAGSCAKYNYRALHKRFLDSVENVVRVYESHSCAVLKKVARHSKCT